MLKLKQFLIKNMLIVDDGGRMGSQPKSDFPWLGGEGESARKWFLMIRGGGGVHTPPKMHDIINEQHLYNWKKNKNFKLNRVKVKIGFNESHSIQIIFCSFQYLKER